MKARKMRERSQKAHMKRNLKDASMKNVIKKLKLVTKIAIPLWEIAKMSYKSLDFKHI
jgi:hypothetical protein